LKRITQVFTGRALYCQLFLDALRRRDLANE
jgi:hypothetical protein